MTVSPLAVDLLIGNRRKRLPPCLGCTIGRGTRPAPRISEIGIFGAQEQPRSRLAHHLLQGIQSMAS
jgi:hypothetical protein